MFCSVFHGPSLAINELLLTFMCINNGISAFRKGIKTLLHSGIGVFLPFQKLLALIQVLWSSTQSKY